MCFVNLGFKSSGGIDIEIGRHIAEAKCSAVYNLQHS